MWRRVLVFVSLVSCPVLAQEARYTLEDALKQVVIANPDLAQAQARRQQARASVEQVYVALNPTVSSTFSYYRTFQPTQSANSGFNNFINSLIPGLIPTGAPDPDTYSGGLVLQQTISTFGRLRWTALAQKLNEKARVQDYRTALLGLLQQAEKAYVTVKASEQQLALVERRRKLRQEFLEVSRNRLKAGLIAEFEVIQSQTQMQSAQIELAQSQLEKETAQTALLILMGEKPRPEVNFAPLQPLPEPPASLEEPLAYALQYRPEVASFRWALASAVSNVEAAWHQSAPDLSLVSQYLLNQVPGTPVQRNWIAGLQLSFPLYDGGAAQVAAQQAEGVVAEIRGSLDSQTRQVEQEVRSKYLRLHSLWQQMRDSDANCKLNDEALQIALNRYRAGLSSSTEWITAQEAWMQAQQNRLNLELDYRQTWADWNRAIAARPAIELPLTSNVEWQDIPRLLGPGEKPDESWLERP